MFILENVRGLVTQHKEDFKHILLRLRTMKNNSYLVSWRAMNTEEHGTHSTASECAFWGCKGMCK